MRIASAIAVVTLALGLNFAAVSRADEKPKEDPVVAAVKQAIAGKEAKFVKVEDKHTFHIKPITIVRDDANKIVGAAGNISHHLSGRPDDQVSYKIVMKDGVLTATVPEIQRGGILRLAGVPGNLADKAGQLAEGSWEHALAKLLNVISLQVEFAK